MTTSTTDQRRNELFQTVSIQGELARTAARLLKQTPAYAEARRRGEARHWLYKESQSFAYAAYEVLLERVDEAGGR